MQNTNETTTVNTETTTKPTETTTKNTREGVGIHAVMRHKTTGEVSTHMEKTRTELARHLRDHRTDYDVLSVFRGKILNIRKQTHFTLN